MGDWLQTESVTFGIPFIEIHAELFEAATEIAAEPLLLGDENAHSCDIIYVRQKWQITFWG